MDAYVSVTRLREGGGAELFARDGGSEVGVGVGNWGWGPTEETNLYSIFLNFHTLSLNYMIICSSGPYIPISISFTYYFFVFQDGW